MLQPEYHKRKYLSVSTLINYSRCKRRYFYSKNGLQSPEESLPPQYGGAMHKAVPLALQTSDLDTALDGFMSIWNEVDENRIAYFGLSYGSGPVLLAAAEIKPPPEFVATFGGYVELLDEIKFALTGGYEYQDIKDKLEPDPWLRNVIVANLLSTFPKEPGLDALIANTDPDKFNQLYDALSIELKETVDDLSPHRIVHQLDMPLYILHSTDDNVVPYTESVKFFDMVSSRTGPATTLSLVSVFTHGEFKKVNASNLFKEYLPSLMDSLRFIYNVLKHV